MHPQYWNFNEARWLEFVEIKGVVMEIDTVIEEAVEELLEPLPLQAEQLAMLLGYHFRLATFRTIRKSILNQVPISSYCESVCWNAIIFMQKIHQL